MDPDRVAFVLLDLARVREGIYAWLRMQQAAELMVDQYRLRMQRRMEGAHLTPADLEREASKSLKESDQTSASQSLAVRKAAVRKEVRRLLEEMRDHQCSNSCLIAAPCHDRLFFCMYRGHAHLCTEHQCLKRCSDNEEQGVKCAFTRLGSDTFESEFDEDPEGVMRKQGGNPSSFHQVVLIKPPRRKRESEKSRELDAQAIHFSLTQYLTSEHLIGPPIEKTAAAAPALAVPPLKRAKTLPSFLMPARTLSDVRPFQCSRPPVMDDRMMEQCSRMAVVMWERFPGKSVVRKGDFARLMVWHHLGIVRSRAPFWTDRDADVWTWLEGLTPAPKVEKDRRPLPTLPPEVVAGLCRFDRDNGSDGIEL